MKRTRRATEIYGWLVEAAIQANRYDWLEALDAIVDALDNGDADLKSVSEAKCGLFGELLEYGATQSSMELEAYRAQLAKQKH